MLYFGMSISPVNFLARVQEKSSPRCKVKNKPFHRKLQHYELLKHCFSTRAFKLIEIAIVGDPKRNHDELHTNNHKILK